MPRLISFFVTTEQVRNQTKTVTRRQGWKFLKVGDVLCGCEKVQGRKSGEPLVRIGLIRVTDVRREPLDRMDVRIYGDMEAVKEGFPEMNGPEFVDMFCEEMGGERGQDVARIEFEY